MTDEEIIEYVIKGKEHPHEDETADLAALENEGTEFVGILVVCKIPLLERAVGLCGRQAKRAKIGYIVYKDTGEGYGTRDTEIFTRRADPLFVVFRSLKQLSLRKMA